MICVELLVDLPWVPGYVYDMKILSDLGLRNTY